MPTNKKTKTPTGKDLSKELGEILSLLKLNFENAWNSEEKAKVEKQLLTGIKKLQKVVNDVKKNKGSMEDKIMNSLHKGLKTTAQGLKKSAKYWKVKK